MSIGTEYAKYLQGGGSLTETEYKNYYDATKTAIGDLINTDPRNRRSDIGQRIFESLDLSSGIAFSKVSRGLHERSKNRWFVKHSREIVLKYVQQGTSYKDYLKNGGWKDFIVIGAKLAGVAITIASGVKAGIHASRIPPDAPKKTITCTDEEGREYELTIIDHPEATKAAVYTGVSVSVGTVTLIAIAPSIFRLLKNVDLDTFFSTPEENTRIKTTSSLKKIASPNFDAWKITHMKNNLTSNPNNWQQHEELSKKICPISRELMLFPVKDKCGHYFDYRSIRGYQLNSEIQNPLECPISTVKPNFALAQIRFDKVEFDRIQGIIRQMNP
jgi:hypothetical protein